jgi:hypothetical protein
MSQYGFDPKSGEWNLRLFPVTQSDIQMEGIRSDHQIYAQAVSNREKYWEHLAKKYDIDIDKIRQYEWLYYKSSRTKRSFLLKSKAENRCYLSPIEQKRIQQIYKRLNKKEKLILDKQD